MGTWRSLLQGELAKRALDSVEEIALALKRETPGAGGFSYAGGEAGIALFFACLAQETGREAHAATAKSYLDRAIDGLAQVSLPPGLFIGMAGIAFTAQEIERILVGPVDPALTEEVDEALAQIAGTKPWASHYDLIHGLAGLGFYALHHGDKAFSDLLVGLVVERLAELAKEDGPGLSFHTPVHLIRREQERARFPSGFYNLGVAHGVGGVIGFLAGACGRPKVARVARRLLEGAVSWLRAQRRPEDGGSAFSGFVEDPSSCRSAWCYGDPGLAWMLLWAGRAARREDWQIEAIEVARRDYQRPREAMQIEDAGICHGAAGLGHILNRLYQATGCEDFAQEATVWFERALELRQPGLAPAGYASWWSEAKEWHGDATLLGGAAGIGLALLSACSATEPCWDVPLLLGTPPVL